LRAEVGSGKSEVGSGKSKVESRKWESNYFAIVQEAGFGVNSGP